VEVNVRKDQWLPVSVTPLSSHDVAILRLDDPTGLEPLPLRMTAAPARNSNVGIYGFPSNPALGPWQRARVDGPLGDGTWQLGFETALPDHLEGASGCPVLNDKNAVAGVFVSHSPLVAEHAAFTPISSFFHLLDFSVVPRNALRCCLIVSDTGTSGTSKLRSAVEAGLTIAAKLLGREPALDIWPVNECFRDDEAYVRTVRQLCIADVAIFDLTSYERAMLVLLGIRSAVRAGVSIATLGTPLTVAELGKAPFNIKEMNLVSHSDEWLESETPLYRILSWRIVNGVAGLATGPAYEDSVCFSSVRHLPPGERRAVPASEGALVLCSYSPGYDDNWNRVRRVLTGQLEQHWPEPVPKVSRSVDLNSRSGRLISETMYGAMRRTDLCVADWTKWPANVFFELGVRLAVHPLGAHCLIDRTKRAENSQQRLLLDRFRPTPYALDTCDQALREIVSAHVSRKAEPNPMSINPTYAIASEFAYAAGDSTAVPVYRELLDSAKLMRSDESEGISAVLYPANAKLVKQTEEAVTNRLLSAWDFINSNLVDRLGGDTELRECYLEICDILAPLLKKRNPEKAKRIYQVGREIRRSK
jgi:hypothetical protein